jgi:hypothetical protein
VSVYGDNAWTPFEFESGCPGDGRPLTGSRVPARGIPVGLFHLSGPSAQTDLPFRKGRGAQSESCFEPSYLRVWSGALRSRFSLTLLA